MILRMSHLLAAAGCLTAAVRTSAFCPSTRSAAVVVPRRHLSMTSTGSSLSSSSTEHRTATTDNNNPANNNPATNNPLHLTPELFKIAKAFAAIGDDKLRYKQLLYMANQLAPMEDSLKIPANKVPGCLSTVYIDAKAVVVGQEEEDDDRTTTTTIRPDDNTIRIHFTGDSDGLLTKGLVALLIRGLNGNTAPDIAAIDPAFIQTCGIAASLTPGRNNGFLNMLAVMKQKAVVVAAAHAVLQQQQQKAAAQGKEESSGDAVVNDDTVVPDSSANSDRPMYHAIRSALAALKPESMHLQDVSYQHAGHNEASAAGAESHFELDIIADAFEGLNLVKRHQLIYMMLGSVMPRIHALSIRAKTPAEAAQTTL